MTIKCEGIDGESISPWGYCLLSSSSSAALSERRRLTSRECFDFILSQSKEGNRLFGYGIGYDVCHWIADLSDSQKTRLAKTGVTQTNQGGVFYRIRYIPNAYFTVQRLGAVPGSKATAHATVVDLMRWHRKPFVDACEEWGVSEHVGFMRDMKDQRETFRSIGDVSAYCLEECRSLAELGEQMTGRLSELGIPISHPFTAGAVAGALMARNRVQDHWQEPPPKVTEAVSCAFFGGREQCSRYGHFTEGVTQWDIRSAYGWAMTKLPDMNGKWERCRTPHVHQHCYLAKSPTDWSLYKVQWDIDEGRHPVMPFPWRAADGRVHYPPRGTGWQWSPIIRSALRNYPGEGIKILDAWHYIPISNSKPFRYISELYEQRRMGGSDPAGALLKSIIVATWGRMCSPGKRPSKTRGQLAWAGMVTALIQERMLDAIHQTGESEFISCCVDGFWTVGGRANELEVSPEIGGWSRSDARELLLLRPACYWKREESSGWTAHTAGIPGGASILQCALAEWAKPEGWRRGRIDLTLRRVKGLLACSVDGDYDKLGKFVELPLTVSFNPGQGRMGHECPTMKHEANWRRWLPYWPPSASITSESASFVSRTGLIDDRWKERQEANAIEETSD